jgi:crotonobetainyl-CoA:carnitine CoA-transferase CaiB-like acyl-CoA transferase
MLVELEYPQSGIVPVPGVEIKLSRTPGSVARRASLLGEDNDAIYGDVLGYSAEDLEKLREQKII